MPRKKQVNNKALDTKVFQQELQKLDQEKNTAEKEIKSFWENIEKLVTELQSQIKKLETDYQKLKNSRKEKLNLTPHNITNKLRDLSDLYKELHDKKLAKKDLIYKTLKTHKDTYKHSNDLAVKQEIIKLIKNLLTASEKWTREMLVSYTKDLQSEINTIDNTISQQLQEQYIVGEQEKKQSTTVVNAAITTKVMSKSKRKTQKPYVVQNEQKSAEDKEKIIQERKEREANLYRLRMAIKQNPITDAPGHTKDQSTQTISTQVKSENTISQLQETAAQTVLHDANPNEIIIRDEQREGFDNRKIMFRVRGSYGKKTGFLQKAYPVTNNESGRNIMHQYIKNNEILSAEALQIYYPPTIQIIIKKNAQSEISSTGAIMGGIGGIFMKEQYAQYKNKNTQQLCSKPLRPGNLNLQEKRQLLWNILQLSLGFKDYFKFRKKNYLESKYQLVYSTINTNNPDYENLTVFFQIGEETIYSGVSPTHKPTHKPTQKVWGGLPFELFALDIYLDRYENLTGSRTDFSDAEIKEGWQWAQNFCEEFLQHQEKKAIELKQQALPIQCTEEHTI